MIGQYHWKSMKECLCFVSVFLYLINLTILECFCFFLTVPFYLIWLWSVFDEGANSWNGTLIKQARLRFSWKWSNYPEQLMFPWFVNDVRKGLPKFSINLRFVSYNTFDTGTIIMLKLTFDCQWEKWQWAFTGETFNFA